jgi:hypothetical protein
MAQPGGFASFVLIERDDNCRMNAAVFFLPFAQSAAQVGTAAVQQLGESLHSAGSAFADLLKPETEAEESEKIEDGVKEPGDASALLALVDQIQNRLQATLQSMGLQLDGELTLSIDADGKISLTGDSDSAAVLEQLINSDPALQGKIAALHRACKASGEADQLEAKLRYQAGKVQLQLPEPAAEDSLAADKQVVA